MVNFKEEGDTHGVMELYTRVSSKMAWETEKDGGALNSKMVINMKDNTVMILSMVMEFINGQMDQNTKEGFSRTKNMEMVFLLIKMEKYLNSHGIME